MSVRLGGGTVRNHPALRPHLHYFDHFDASVLPLEDQFAHQDKLELTVGEFTSILGTEVAEDATLDHVFLPALDVSGNVGPTAAERIGSEETYAAVADAVLVPDPDGSGWLRALTGARDELTEPMRETLRAIAGMSATRLHGHPDDMVRQALVCAEQPVDQQPQRWLRAPLEASMVCVLHHRRSDRDLTLAPWTTRAIAEGEVHELLMVDSTADLTRPVDQVSYLGFGRFPAGLLVVGDTLIREGRPLAKLVGFDDTHLPNHMNIVFQALSEGRTGQELGIRPKEVLILGPRL
jgi:hypothetical protein